VNASLHGLLAESQRAGLVLYLASGTVRWRGPKPSPELLSRLREHRDAIRQYLEASRFGLTPDQVPWIHVARQVLAGEFSGAAGSLRASLVIGFKAVPHPICQQALDSIKGQTKRS